jgi:hypothetical protein
MQGEGESGMGDEVESNHAHSLLEDIWKIFRRYSKDSTSAYGITVGQHFEHLELVVQPISLLNGASKS